MPWEINGEFSTEFKVKSTLKTDVETYMKDFNILWSGRKVNEILDNEIF